MEILYWIILIEALIPFVILKDDILDSIFPNSYARLRFITRNNHIVYRHERLPKNNEFHFNNGVYFPDTSIPYKDGPVAAYIYNEGNPNPVDLRTIATKENPEMLKRFKEISIADMFKGENGIGSFMAKYWWVIIIIFIAVIGYITWQNNQSQQLLLNITQTRTG